MVMIIIRIVVVRTKFHNLFVILHFNVVMTYFLNFSFWDIDLDVGSCLRLEVCYSKKKFKVRL